MNVTMEGYEYRSAEDIAPAFAAMAQAGVTAVLVLGHPLVLLHRERISKLAVQHRVAAIQRWEEVAEAGGLMSYGGRIIDELRALPYFIDKF